MRRRRRRRSPTPRCCSGTPNSHGSSRSRRAQAAERRREAPLTPLTKAAGASISTFMQKQRMARAGGRCARGTRGLRRLRCCCTRCTCLGRPTSSQCTAASQRSIRHCYRHRVSSSTWLLRSHSSCLPHRTSRLSRASQNGWPLPAVAPRSTRSARGCAPCCRLSALCIASASDTARSAPPRCVSAPAHSCASSTQAFRRAPRVSSRPTTRPRPSTSSRAAPRPSPPIAILPARCYSSCSPARRRGGTTNCAALRTLRRRRRSKCPPRSKTRAATAWLTAGGSLWICSKRRLQSVSPLCRLYSGPSSRLSAQRHRRRCRRCPLTASACCRCFCQRPLVRR
mmetsp:Transcript_6259/g.14445  ORF Transcript_6259/g.14445 Transcript_6259/m.14445 type:complete len:340 (+) Transcript_6259:1771-2790(+)